MEEALGLVEEALGLVEEGLGGIRTGEDSGSFEELMD